MVSDGMTLRLRRVERDMCAAAVPPSMQAR